MADTIQTGATGAVVVPPVSGEPKPKEQTNADLKSAPWVQEMAAELKALRAEKAEQERKKLEADKQTEIDLATKEQDYNRALQLQTEQSEAKVKAAESKALFAEIKTALVSKGAKPTADGLFKVAMAEYNPEKHKTVEAFAEQLKINDAYAVFFLDASRQVIPAPIGAPVNPMSVDWAQVKAWETGTDKEKQKEARRLIGEYRNAHGKYPYKLEE
jgi:hypothetical protein